MTDQDQEPKEPEEVARLRGDVAGKEPVHVAKWWDDPSVAEAIKLHQWDIVGAEVDHTLAKLTSVSGDAPALYTAKWESEVPADILDKTIDMCRLDNIPVLRTVEVPWSDGQVDQADGPTIEEQIETRFHDAIEHVNERVHEANDAAIIQTLEAPPPKKLRRRGKHR